MIKKYLLTSVIILILFSIFHFFYYNNKIANLTQEIYKNKTAEVIDLFDTEVEKKFGKTFAMTYLISQDKKLIDALVKKDRTLIDFTKTIEEIQKYGEYKNLWIQIIDKDGYSFYRSWTKKVGDHAASARVDIVEMLKDPKPMRGISTGRFDMTFKTMIPLYNGDEFLGMIEMISKFNSIALILEKYQVKPLMVVHEDYTKRFIKPFTGLFIGKNYVANINASKELMKKAEKFGIKKLMYLDKPFILDTYLVFKTEIKNINAGDMGFFIFFFDEKKLDKSTVYNFQTGYFSKIIVALVLLILVMLYMFYKNYSDKLNKEVIKKTSEIEKQKKQLSSLLKTYDESVIFSKADLSGKITYASSAFCEISGYSKEELIGKPHNIIRHPDMKKTTFEELWKTIQSGKIWNGEVKNLRKDGSYYWVDATVEPIFDDKNKIIGYLSKRNDITARKEYEQQQIVMQNQSKLAAMGEMIGNIAHQWRQPLSVITTIASGIQLKQEMGMLEKKDINEGMQKAFESANYLSDTIETFRNFLQDSKEYKEVCLNEILDIVENILKATLVNNKINFINNVSKEDKLYLKLISGELEQVIINIINNSKDAFVEKRIKEPRNITVNLTREENHILLTLEDNAGGIPDDVLPKIFEPYYTTKDKSIGTGLGLYMSYKIIHESLNGELYADNQNDGAKFYIKLPL